MALTTQDGVVLQGVLFKPVCCSCRPAVLIAGGLGIGQRFYAPFAAWLAQRGHTVLTFDLRGMGASRGPAHRHSLRGLNADMMTWARQDFPAAVRTLSTLSGGGQIVVVGHSLGAHHAAMTDANTQQLIRRLVSVAAGSGYWRDWAAPSRWRAPLMLHLAAPVLVPLMGYFPGRTLRMVGDLPGPAMRQWIQWCKHPEFAWGAEPDLVWPSLQSARFPIQALGFTDDEAMTETSIRKLLAAMPGASSQLQMIAPAEVGISRIGHVGAFRASASEKLWLRMEQALSGDG